MTRGDARRVVTRAGAALLLVGLLSSCTAKVDVTPVPTEASGPYACDGVPQKGPELILGGQAPVVRPPTPGTRTTDPLWRCTFDDGTRRLVVKDELLTASADFGRDEEAAIRVMQSARSGQPIEAPFPGQGYSTSGAAMWVCNGRVVLVDLISEPIPERDARQDVTNLLLSQLPFVCEGVEMPEADGPSAS